MQGQEFVLIALNLAESQLSHESAVEAQVKHVLSHIEHEAAETSK